MAMCVVMCDGGCDYVYGVGVYSCVMVCMCVAMCYGVGGV